MDSVFHTLEFDRIRDRLAQHAASVLGAEQTLLLQPIFEQALLRETLTQTTELRDILDYDQAIPIEGFVDIRPVAKKIALAGAVLLPEEFVDLARCLSVVSRLHRFFATRHEKIPSLLKIVTQLHPLPGLEKEIERCIDLQTAEIKDQASPDLARIRRQILSTESLVRKKIEAYLKQLGSQGFLQEHIIAVRNSRLVLVVKDEYKRRVRGLIHGQSASGASVFLEPLDVVEDNNRVQELLGEETREIERILRALTDRARMDNDAIEQNLAAFTLLDFHYAKASFSRNLHATQPEIVPYPIVAIARGRHPLLVLRLGEKYVEPLDITLGAELSSLIISGPNAGGKTVALKTIGLLVCMALSGLHIPAMPNSQIGSITKIFASIGDQQSIENDLSTFSSHLADLKQIHDSADDHSLVLIDEIGSGTDPEEGIALAISLLESLTMRGSLCVVTTHLSPLKAFAYRTKKAENASLEFDVQTLQPTYRFRVGIPGSSYAFEIAQRMGLASDITERARALIGSNKDQFEGLLLELESKIQQYTQLLHQVNIKETELRGLVKLYRDRSDLLRKEENRLKRQAHAEAEEIIRQANIAVEHAIREIREGQARRESIKAAKASLEMQQQHLDVLKEQVAEPESVEEVEDDSPIGTGDLVLWRKLGSIGKVVSSPDKQGRVLLQVQDVKMRAPLTELAKTSKRQARQTMVRIHLEKDEPVHTEIDLRGMRVEEARTALDTFLDEAIVNGLHEIRIIHGKGTGRLRVDVGEYLKNHPQVSTYRLGNWNEGQAGVTVVQLKE